MRSAPRRWPVLMPALVLMSFGVFPLGMSPRAAAEAPPAGDALPAEPEDEDEDDWGEDKQDGDGDEWGEGAGGDGEGDDWGEDVGGDDDFGDDFDGGDETLGASMIGAPSPWSLTGFYRSDLDFWVERFDDYPLARARQNLDLRGSYKTDRLRLVASVHAEYDFAYLVGRDRFDQATLDAYEWLVDFRPTYAELTLGSVDIAFGKQVVAWGEGDALSIMDAVNPRDLREFSLSDLEDLRLPVLATRISWFPGLHRLDLMVVHESFFGYRSPPLGPFSPFFNIIGGAGDGTLEQIFADKDVYYVSKQDRFDISQQELFMRWSYRGEGIDLAAYFTSTLDDIGLVVAPTLQEIIAGGQRVNFGLDHQRYAMMGTSGALPVEDWLLKWELNLTLDRPYNVVIQSDNPLIEFELGAADLDLIGGMFGIVYSGVTDTIFALEMLQLFPLESRQDLIFPLDVPQIALRFSHRALRDDLNIDGAISLLGWTAELGWLARVGLNYRFAQGLRIGGGFVTYQPSSDPGPLSGLDRHDRLFIEFRWDFTVL